MARLNIDTGTLGNSATGDTLRPAMTKINTNFIEVYDDLAGASLGGLFTNNETNGDVKIFTALSVIGHFYFFCKVLFFGKKHSVQYLFCSRTFFNQLLFEMTLFMILKFFLIIRSNQTLRTTFKPFFSNQ